MNRFYDRHNAPKIVVNITAPDSELIRLRSALARIQESAINSRTACQSAANSVPHPYRKLSKALENISTHFSYIEAIAKEATHDH